jgi:uncharacterized protein with GYD domain
MALYLYQANYSADAVKALVKNPQDREAGARKLIEAGGGKLHHMYFCFGEWDIVARIEAPDDITYAGIAIAVAASGTVSRAQTTNLFTAQAAQEAMGKAGGALAAYIGPMG